MVLIRCDVCILIPMNMSCSLQRKTECVNKQFSFKKLEQTRCAIPEFGGSRLDRRVHFARLGTRLLFVVLLKQSLPA